MAEGGTRSAAVVGTGLIGGSIGLALRDRGWHVTGHDRDPARAERAKELGAVDAVGRTPDVEVTFVATPTGSVVEEVRAALAAGAPLVTDVGGVKGPVVDLVDDARFVGGHPMAGSEQEGIDAARPDLFEGAAWVLTPGPATDDHAYARLAGIVSSLGADVIALEPHRHDALVATVSHVPHLTAATLMRLTQDRATEQRALLRLAAGGFRDMTRVAAGQPAMWLDICDDNRSAIVEVLDHLIEELGETRDAVAKGDREGLSDALEQARTARVSLPGRYRRPDEMAEVRVPIADEAGMVARVATLASDLGVNIADLEIAHSSEGDRGVLILVVERDDADALRDALAGDGHQPSVHGLG